jgi:hypothetical protein
LGYRDDPPKRVNAQQLDEQYEELVFDQWVPLPLRTWFWVTYVLVLAAGAVALEVALYYTKKYHGTR